MKRNNIHMRILEEKEKATKSIFKAIMTENFQAWQKKKKKTSRSRSPKDPKKGEPQYHKPH